MPVPRDGIISVCLERGLGAQMPILHHASEPIPLALDILAR